jgi:serine/threonine-protein kinase HipA
MTKWYIHAGWISDDPLIGTIYIDKVRGEELFSFEYESSWLESHPDVHLGPEIMPYTGRQYSLKDRSFGFLEDIAPDRWGRKLLDRREALAALYEGRSPRKLMLSDYIAGVEDYTRPGGMRISVNATYISASDNMEVPPITELRELEQAVEGFEKQDKNEERWLNMLLRPGTSLGGARPKANVIDTDGALWIAKFPSKNDETDISAWEMTAQDIMAKCGLSTPECRYENISGKGIFLSKRFDREGSKRIHFASAMTMLGLIDGTGEGSYRQIADHLREHGEKASEDIRELWSRAAFSFAVNNTDDHLRNHAFVLGKNGWRLSPAYDVNPVPVHSESLPITNEYTYKNEYALIKYAHEFFLTEEEAKARLKTIIEIVQDSWKDTAKKYGVSRKEIEKMAPAFIQTTQS